MTYKEIQELIKLVDKSNLAEVKLNQGDFKITIRSMKFYEGKQSGSVPYYPSTPAPVMQVPQPAPQASPAPQAQTTASDEKPAAEAAPGGNYVEVKSPMVGTFYRSSSPDKPPYVQVGDVIETGSVVCIVEAMKLFNEIESDVRGKIIKVLVDDASPVEYDQPLFLVDPKG